MNSVYHTTADATGIYVERSAVELARSEAAMEQLDAAHFHISSTPLYSGVAFVPVHRPPSRVQTLAQHYEVIEEEHEIAFLPR